ncbi:outer membrane protein assembly factor BamB family protein [Winogradskya humida]|uniref:Pyrrolo-quinoline quinone repeat domain-containing protein n=1 Tax=Winogradskya humida TaxID=113566 RepID=A0ABQ3ZSC9_9ACTN|nr:PQQ-binding-like beta-propeller repeat protein [Actinoplanes humidus]GIE21495.1 hypothetical protein Ahu01nite_045970 [Actinoplanes humidus]
MSTDLDEIFASLNHQADGVPLGPPVAARRRGDQIRRTRFAITAVTVVVCLAFAGTSFAWRNHHTAPAAPTWSLAEVGSPRSFGVTVTYAATAVSTKAVFTAWRGLDGVVGVSAADLHTGATTWLRKRLGTFDRLTGVVALPAAVLVNVRGDRGSTMYVLDPATGRERWHFPYATDDDLVYYNDLLVTQSAATGETRALSWSDGTTRWTLPAEADRAQRTLGMHVRSDEMSLTFTDRNLIQITRSGKVEYRDAGTGTLRGTTAAIVPTGAPVAYEGIVFVPGTGFTPGATQIVRTELADPQPRNIYESLPGHHIDAIAPCGDRLCLTVTPPDRSAVLTTIGPGFASTDWQTPATPDATIVQPLGDRILVTGPSESILYTTDGRKVTAAAHMSWIDKDSLLALPGPNGGEIVRISALTGTRQVLGTMPPSDNPCAWTTDRLACPDETALRIFSLA